MAKKLKVIVTVEGGVVQNVNLPKGVEVVVKDYDCDDDTDPCVKTDENGDKYWESVWVG